MGTTTRVKTVRDLQVYRKSFNAAMEIFHITKALQREEIYSLTDQIRRSSRSVCSNHAEAWRKRKYKAVFVNKLTDLGQEASETQIWLEFALRCNYIDPAVFSRLDGLYDEVFGMLSAMEIKADSFCNE